MNKQTKSNKKKQPVALATPKDIQFMLSTLTANAIKSHQGMYGTHR